MLAFVTGIALKLGVPARFAKAAGIAGAILLALLLLWGAKAAYDASVISTHDARQDAATTKADRKADESAGEQRRADDNRLSTEAGQLQETRTNAISDRDRRIARARCLRAQQDARASGRQPSPCH